MKVGDFTKHILKEVAQTTKSMFRIYCGTQLNGRDDAVESFGVLTLGFNEDILLKGVVDEKTVNFIYERSLLSRGEIIYNCLDDNTVASLPYIMGALVEAALADLSRNRFVGSLKIVKFKGARKYYLAEMKIVVKDINRDNSFKHRLGDTLPEQDERCLFNAMQSLSKDIERNGKKVKSLEIHFPLASDVHVGLVVRYADGNEESAYYDIYANGVVRNIDVGLRHLNMERIYKAFVKTRIPAYCIRYNVGSKGKVKYLKKFKNHFQVQFI